MKYFFSFLFFLFSPIVIALPQESKLTIRTGVGYYADLMGMYDGPVNWLESGFRFNTGFYLNGRISISSIDWKISEGIFKGYRTMAIRQMIDLTFSKQLKIVNQHFLEPSLGFKLKREYSYYPNITIQNNDGQIIYYTSYSKIFYEFGFTICLDYYYQFKSGFFMGLRADTNVIWALGFEGLTFSPIFGFRF